MLLYALGTAACARRRTSGCWSLFRVVASLGIGGEWAAGAAMVAEVVPEKRRVEAGALLYTSAPLGLFLATFVNFQIAGVCFKGSPETSWRYVFLCGLIPAAVALRRAPVRARARALEAGGERLGDATRASPSCSRRRIARSRSRGSRHGGDRAHHLVELQRLHPDRRRRASRRRTPRRRASSAARRWRWSSTGRRWPPTCFNLGGLIGTLLTIPAAKVMGRRTMFAHSTSCSPARRCWRRSASTLPPQTRLYMYFFIGLTVFGVFGSFTYYLPELFPTRLRGTGAGFCYNVGRVIAAGGPFLVGTVASRGADALGSGAARAVLGGRRAARGAALAADRHRDEGARARRLSGGPGWALSARAAPARPPA